MQGASQPSSHNGASVGEVVLSHSRASVGDVVSSHSGVGAAKSSLNSVIDSMCVTVFDRRHRESVV